MSRTQDEAKERTEVCLKAIKETLERSSVVLVLGKTGAGKSSLVESITGATGMSGNSTSPVTAECQIAEYDQDGHSIYFIDTPGFEDDKSACDTFSKIIIFLDKIRSYITLVGVWYVVDNSVTRDVEFDLKLVEWLAALCGVDYYPHITLVTTHWGCTHPQEFKELEGKFRKRKSKWTTAMSEQIHTYQHGKIYADGVETSEAPTLSWYDQDALRDNVRDLVHRRCQAVPQVQPRIIQELENGTSFEDISAAKILRPPTRMPEPSPPEETADISPHGPPESEQHWAVRVFSGLFTWAANNVQIDLNQGSHGLSGGVGFGGIRSNFDFGQGSQPRGTTRVPGNWDRNSVVDDFKSHGMDSSLAGRTAWAQRNGVTSSFPPGSAEFNMATQKRFREVNSKR
ncbi:P-loop containing nucleoside triphosphate hydrolase protein [Acephala macrosclerotiorum]|nr:P-loop containing nucleoside triphosphate hydrolase protein [Acephala macrosclerotiorum]